MRRTFLPVTKPPFFARVRLDWGLVWRRRCRFLGRLFCFRCPRNCKRHQSKKLRKQRRWKPNRIVLPFREWKHRRLRRCNRRKFTLLPAVLQARRRRHLTVHKQKFFSADNSCSTTGFLKRNSPDFLASPAPRQIAAKCC